jgi:hypothetical protein
MNHANFSNNLHDFFIHVRTKVGITTGLNIFYFVSLLNKLRYLNHGHHPRFIFSFIIKFYEARIVTKAKHKKRETFKPLTLGGSHDMFTSARSTNPYSRSSSAGMAHAHWFNNRIAARQKIGGLRPIGCW